MEILEKIVEFIAGDNPSIWEISLVFLFFYFFLIMFLIQYLINVNRVIARLIDFWLWKMAWLIVWIYFWVWIALGAIVAIIDFFYFIPNSLTVGHAIIFCLVLSSIFIVILQRSTDGPHWYKFNYVKLNDFDKCIYRWALNDKGLDNYPWCSSGHKDGWWKDECKIRYQDLVENGKLQDYLSNVY